MTEDIRLQCHNTQTHPKQRRIVAEFHSLLSKAADPRLIESKMYIGS